jgi:hypothetical protein
MRPWHLLLGILLLAGCGRDGDAEFRTIPLSYMSSEEARQLISGQLAGLDFMAVSYHEDPPTVILRGPDAQVNQVADLVQRFDRPSPNVQLRFQVIEADGFTTTDPAISDVEGALRGLLRFQGYRLVAESMVQAQAPGTAGQRLMAHDGRRFEIRARLARVLQRDTARAVSLEVDLSEGGTSLLGTSLTVPSGQTVVVGTAQAGREGNTLILVVRPRIE